MESTQRNRPPKTSRWTNTVPVAHTGLAREGVASGLQKQAEWSQRWGLPPAGARGRPKGIAREDMPEEGLASAVRYLPPAPGRQWSAAPGSVVDRYVAARNCHTADNMDMDMDMDMDIDMDFVFGRGEGGG